jgi:hypothetical protein
VQRVGCDGAGDVSAWKSLSQVRMGAGMLICSLGGKSGTRGGLPEGATITEHAGVARTKDRSTEKRRTEYASTEEQGQRRGRSSDERRRRTKNLRLH